MSPDTALLQPYNRLQEEAAAQSGTAALEGRGRERGPAEGDRDGGHSCEKQQSGVRVQRQAWVRGETLRPPRPAPALKVRLVKPYRRTRGRPAPTG